MDNSTIAILNTVNTLLERHGIGPCDAVVELSEQQDGGVVLSFESPPDTQVGEASFMNMLRNLNLSPDNFKLRGTDQQVYAALQRAMRIAPRARAQR